MLVFLSYPTKDKHIAAEVAKFFNDLGVETFMAHEDIEVSRGWQAEILEAFHEADVFVAIVSANYLVSPYCLQESGMAMLHHEEMTIMPLAVDGSTPPGFMNHIQAKKCAPGNSKANTPILCAGLLNQDFKLAVGLIVDQLERVRSWAAAEQWFALLEPYLGSLTKSQGLDVLEAAAGNNQLAGARRCADGLRALYKKHGKFSEEQHQNYLEQFL